jgi:hypothetical protein
MENIIINAVSLVVIVLSVIYIIRDYRASKRLNNIKSEVDLCSEQIKDFNNNVLSIHEKLEFIEQRLTNIEQTVSAESKYTKLD